MDQDFWDDYKVRGDRAITAEWRAFQDALARWLEIIDGDTEAQEAIRNIETSGDFDAWLSALNEERGGFIGSTRLNWPSGDIPRLGAHLYLVRAWSKSWAAASQFSIKIFGQTQFDSAVQSLQSGVVEPLIEDLERHLRRLNRKKLQVAVPAADRIVTLDHNKSEATQAIAAIVAVEKSLEGSNLFDNDTRDRAWAELAAGKLLLQQKTSRLDALLAVLVRGLQYIAEKGAGAVIGELAKAALIAVAAYIGITL